MLKYQLPMLSCYKNQSKSTKEKSVVGKECIVFPTYAYRNPQVPSEWIIQSKGWTVSFEKELDLKRRLLKFITKCISGKLEGNPLFDRRFKYFLAKGNKHRSLRLQVTDDMGKLIQPFTLRSSDNGLFSAQLHLPDSPTRPLTHLWLREVNKKDRRRPMGAYDGWISLIEPDGVSVISDIDDTIKQTHVTSGARTVLNNTFFCPSQPVPGMAAHYRQWYQLGISFHYVSNSPIQLARMLLNFLQNHQFPPGSLHLRDLQHILSELIEPPGQSKVETIRAILKDFPHRQFVLIGDSGESDLDVYTQIATEFPQQILKIYIRHVPTEPTEVQTDSNKIMVESDQVNFDPTDIQQTKEETQESIKPTTQLASLVIPEPVTAILPQMSSSEAELRERVAEAQKLLSDVDIVLFEHVNELEIKK